MRPKRHDCAAVAESLRGGGGDTHDCETASQRFSPEEIVVLEPPSRRTASSSAAGEDVCGVFRRGSGLERAFVCLGRLGEAKKICLLILIATIVLVLELTNLLLNTGCPAAAASFAAAASDDAAAAADASSIQVSPRRGILFLDGVNATAARASSSLAEVFRAIETLVQRLEFSADLNNNSILDRRRQH